MKYLKIAGVVAFALVVFAAPALAETQTVKVSGALDVMHLYRHNYDLRDDNDQGSVQAGGTVRAINQTLTISDGGESDNLFMSIAQVEVAADLTDNVSVVIRLVNQRDWNARAFEDSSLDETGANPEIAATDENQTEEFDVGVDLAYMQLKEIWYAPLTLTIGRQDIWFGRGNQIGLNRQDPNNSITANEFTAIVGFDALRGTLDFEPWTVDLVMAIIDENAVDTEDDTQLYWMNVNYQFAQYNAEAETYFGARDDRSTIRRTTGSTVNTRQSEAGDRTYTIGGRAQFDPIENIVLGGELAYQFGDYAQSSGNHRDRHAWFLEMFGEYSFQNQWNPTVGLALVHQSGEDTFSGTDEYNAWSGPYAGQTWGDIRSFQESFYETASIRDQIGNSNQNHISLYGNLSPMEDLMLDLWWYYFWADEEYLAGGTTGAAVDDDIGNEVDAHLTYDYTEDVAFGTWLSVFFPGEVYEGNADSTATQVVSKVSVAF